MSIDLFQSRRNYNERCHWWSRDERDLSEPDELIMKRVPTGTFMAKEVSPEQGIDVNIGNSFLFEKSAITLKSPDNLFGIQEKDLVEYEGDKWIVTNVQRVKAKIQNTTFGKLDSCSHFWYLELRK